MYKSAYKQTTDCYNGSPYNLNLWRAIADKNTFSYNSKTIITISKLSLQFINYVHDSNTKYIIHKLSLKL